MELASAEKSFGWVNKWEKGAPGRILLLLMELLGKAKNVKNAFE